MTETVMAEKQVSHTPGPWHSKSYKHPNAKGRITSWTIEIDETDEYPDIVIGEIYGPGEGSPEMEANARLIAAAPDLLNAARQVLFFLQAAGYCGGGSAPDALLQKAIAKAEAIS